MLKFLLLLVVVLFAGWMFGRRRGGPAAPSQRPPAAAPAAMVACAHCAVHLPQTEALTDAEGRSYCSEAHRLAGPPR